MPPDSPRPYRCPQAPPGWNVPGRERADDVDHVLTLVSPPPANGTPDFHEHPDPNPFLRFRELLHGFQLARGSRGGERAFLARVRSLGRALEGAGAAGPRATPLERSDRLSDALGFQPEGGVWIKDETQSPGGHKLRHLFGIALQLAPPSASETPLCLALSEADGGREALAAARVARAAGHPLEVHLAAATAPALTRRLLDLGARPVFAAPCEEGCCDSAQRRAREAAEAGEAIPFSSRESENGLALEGGRTLGFELASDLESGAAGVPALDRLFLQVGRGALASGAIQGFAELIRRGLSLWLPRVHAVQSAGAFPLRRAYDRLVRRALARLEREEGLAPPTRSAGDRRRADLLRARFNSPAVQAELRYAATHRSEFMWPWEREPEGAARELLHREVDAWFPVLRGMLASGGWPLVVPDRTLQRAAASARTTAGAARGRPLPLSATAGLAGVFALRQEGALGDTERVAVVWTGGGD